MTRSETVKVTLVGGPCDGIEVEVLPGHKRTWIKPTVDGHGDVTDRAAIYSGDTGTGKLHFIETAEIKYEPN